MVDDFISLGWYCGVATSMSKNGFIFNHELSRGFEEEYEDVHSKYSRRIDFFRTKIATRKVFFACC